MIDNNPIKVMTLHNGRKVVFDALIQYICEELEKKGFQKDKFTGFIGFHLFNNILVNYSSEYNLHQELCEWESDYETIRCEIENIFNTAIDNISMIIKQPLIITIHGIYQDLGDKEAQEWCNKRKEKILKILESQDIYRYDIEHNDMEVTIILESFKDDSIGTILTQLSKV